MVHTPRGKALPWRMQCKLDVAYTSDKVLKEQATADGRKARTMESKSMNGFEITVSVDGGASQVFVPQGFFVVECLCSFMKLRVEWRALPTGTLKKLFVFPSCASHIRSAQRMFHFISSLSCFNF